MTESEKTVHCVHLMYYLRMKYPQDFSPNIYFLRKFELVV